MRRCSFFFLLVFTFHLFAYEEFDGHVPVSTTYEPQAMPSGSVSVLSGDYCESPIDLFVDGPEPVCIQRTYVSSYSPDWHRGHWRIQADEIRTRLESCHRRITATLLEPDGGVYAYVPVDPNSWGVAPGTTPEWDLKLKNQDGLCNTAGGDLTAHSDVAVYKLHFSRGPFTFKLTKGDGEVHHYKNMRNKNYKRRDNRKPVNDRWACWKVVRPNGHRIFYEYDENKSLSKIYSTDKSEKTVFGWITITHKRINDKEKHLICQGSDGQELTYIYRDMRGGKYKKKDQKFVLVKVIHPGGRVEEYTYERPDHDQYKPLSIEDHVYPENGQIRNFYCKRGTTYIKYRGKQSKRENAKVRRGDARLGRVNLQQAPVGPNGLLQTLFKYHYAIRGCEGEWRELQHTDVVDGDGARCRYEVTYEGRISAIYRFDGYSPISKETRSWNKENGRLLSKAFYGGGERIWQRSFKYNADGMVLEEALEGNLTGSGSDSIYTRIRTYSDDHLRNCLSESDGFITTYFSYLPNTNLVTEKRVEVDGIVCERVTNRYDDWGICIEARSTEGSQCRIVRIDPLRDGPGLGKPHTQTTLYLDNHGEEQLLDRRIYHYNRCSRPYQIDHYDANNRFAYSIFYAYDEANNLVSETNALSEPIHYTYDRNGNLLSTQTPRHDYSTHNVYDAANRLVATKKRSIKGEVFKSHISYTRMGRKKSERDFFGNTTQYKRDVCGRPVEIHHPKIQDENEEWVTPITKRKYDGADRVIEEIAPDGGVTTTEYTARNDPMLIRYPDKTYELFEYDIRGQLIKKVQRNGSTDLFERDYKGRILSTTTLSPDGEVLRTTSATYDGPLLTSETDGEGIVTHYTYDGAGRLIERIRGESRTTYTYDSLGRKESARRWLSSDAWQGTLWFYDLLGRVTEKRTENHLGDCFSCTQYRYDGDGNKILERIYLGNSEIAEHRYAYDILGRQIYYTDPLGYSTTTLYDKLKKTTIDSLGNSTEVLLDGQGHPIQINRQNSAGEILQQVFFGYDLAGRKVLRREIVKTPDADDREVLTRWTYNQMGQIIRLDEACDTPLQRTTRYAYNGLGQLATTLKPSGTQVYRRYDDLGRLFSHGDYEYTYNGNNQIVSILSPTGTTTRTYDNQGRLTEETLETGLSTRYSYDPLNRKTCLTLHDGSSVTYTYDGPHLSTVTRLDPHENSIYTHTYNAWDWRGKPLSHGQTILTYDPLGRCTSIETPSYSSELTYDAVGNLTTRLSTQSDETYTYDDLYQLTSEPSHTYAYDSLRNRIQCDEMSHPTDELNQLLCATYDRDGRLIAYDNHTYTYDILDRLIEVSTPTTTITYTYDSENRLLSRTEGSETTHFLYDGNCEIGAANTDHTIIQFRTLGYGLGAEIGAAVLIELNSIPYLPIHDHRGSLITLTDLSHNPLQTYSYTAFGTLSTPDPISPWLFSSKRRDPTTHLIYFLHRHYSPTLARWLTPDPLGLSQGPNLYAYCNNAPLTSLDPWGLYAFLTSLNPFSRGSFSQRGGFSGQKFAFGNLGFARPTFGSAWISNRNMERSSFDTVGAFPSIRGAQVLSINGQWMNRKAAEWQAEQLASRMSRNTGFFHVPTGGKAKDTVNSALLRAGFLSRYSKELAAEVRNRLGQSDDQVILVPYSRGAIHTYQALYELAPAERQRVDVYSIGAGKLIPKALCRKAVNFRSRMDMVGQWFAADKHYYHNPSEYDIVELPPTPRSFMDHSLSSDAQQRAFDMISERILADFPEVR